MTVVAVASCPRCSVIMPGVGQLINGETDKAIGVFVVAVATGTAFLGGLPLIGGISGSSISARTSTRSATRTSRVAASASLAC